MNKNIAGILYSSYKAKCKGKESENEGSHSDFKLPNLHKSLDLRLGQMDKDRQLLS